MFQAAIAGCGPSEREVDLQNQLEKTEKRLEKTEERLANTEEKLATTEQQLTSATQELTSATQELTSAERKVEAVTGELEALTEERDALRAEMAKAVESRFIVVTKEYREADGYGSSVGSVEFVIARTKIGYDCWTGTKRRFEIPRSHAEIITADDAAIRLLVDVQELYAKNSKLIDERNTITGHLQQAQQQQNQLNQAQQQLRLLQQLQQFEQGEDQKMMNQLKLMEQLKRLQNQR